MMTKETAFSRWYVKNKEKFNQKRREAYDNDPEYRQAVLERQNKYRLTHPPARRIKEPVRSVNGRQVEVHRIGYAAEQIGREEQVIRQWHAKGWIPPCTVDSPHRYYTLNQIELMRGLAKVINSVRYMKEVREAAILKQAVFIHEHWEE